MVRVLVDYSIDLRSFQFARKTLFAFVSRLRTRPSPTPKMPDRVLHTRLDGPGLFLFEVAGQNHYQPAILRSEPSNPHDCNAIAVEISGLKVGYLDRHTATKLTNLCKRLGFDRIEATCKAKLAGYRSHADQSAKVNVMLDKKPGTRDRGQSTRDGRGDPDPIKAQTQRPTGAWLIPSPLATG